MFEAPQHRMIKATNLRIRQSMINVKQNGVGHRRRWGGHRVLPISYSFPERALFDWRAALHIFVQTQITLFYFKT